MLPSHGSIVVFFNDSDIKELIFMAAGLLCLSFLWGIVVFSGMPVP